MRPGKTFGTCLDLSKLIATLAGSDLVVREANPETWRAETDLFSIESAVVARAVNKRRREFETGRMLARKAMADLGLPGQPIPASDNGAPIWPRGVVGSISHTDRWCVAVVARSNEVQAVGVDVEEDHPLDRSLLRMICTEAERRRLSCKPDAVALMEAKRIFSAKEAVFKALSPCLHLRFIGFEAVTVSFDRMSWTATPEDPTLARRLNGQPLHGQWSEWNHLIGTLIAIRPSGMLTELH